MAKTAEEKMANIVEFSVSYPEVDPGLGEHLHPEEKVLAGQLADAIEKSIRAQYYPGYARRDAHPKAHGIVRADFRVNASIANNLAKGIFIPGKTYEAWIRFSNGLEDDDNKDDARGMAIKVMGVPGEKLLEDDRDATTQDFIMINHPVFFMNDPQRYLSFVEKSSSQSLLSKLTIPFTLGLKGTLAAKELGKGKISNPLQARYWSMVPYQLGIGQGRQAVKFSVKPSLATTDPIPNNPGPNYLRDALRDTLRKSDATFSFLVQPRTSDSLSVEDSLTEWDEEQAPFHEVATVYIPQQEFDTAEQNKFAENVSFNPWHALPEHRPLGVVNRVRKVVYDHISRVRHGMNSVERKEPIPGESLHFLAGAHPPPQ
jgi:hypothetical protein